MNVIDILILAALAVSVIFGMYRGFISGVLSVAALIGGEEGRRYLSIVLPRVVMFDHAGPASLDLHSTTTSAHDIPAGK